MKCIPLLIALSTIFFSFEQEIKSNDDILNFSWIEYDFGSVLLGERKECDLFIKNNSNKRISIAYLIAGCHCVEVSVNKKKIKPSQTIGVHIVFIPGISSTGHIEQCFYIGIKGQDNPVRFVIKAEMLVE